MSKLLSGCFTSIFGTDRPEKQIISKGYFKQFKIANIKPRIHPGFIQSHKLNKLDIAVQCMPPNNIASAHTTLQSFTTKKFHIRYAHLPSIKAKSQLPVVKSELNIRSIGRQYDNLVIKEGRMSNIDFMKYGRLFDSLNVKTNTNMSKQSLDHFGYTKYDSLLRTMRQPKWCVPGKEINF